MCIREVKPDPFKQFFNISYFTKVPSILHSYFIHTRLNVNEYFHIKNSVTLAKPFIEFIFSNFFWYKKMDP